MKLVLFEIEEIFNGQSVTKSPCVKCDMKSDKHGTSVASVNNAQIKTWAERKNELFEFLNFIQMKTSSSLSGLIAALFSLSKCKLWFVSLMSPL